MSHLPFVKECGKAFCDVTSPVNLSRNMVRNFVM